MFGRAALEQLETHVARRTDGGNGADLQETRRDSVEPEGIGDL
jgi:hypothetical protein